jgi:hypothetical protein
MFKEKEDGEEVDNNSQFNVVAFCWEMVIGGISSGEIVNQVSNAKRLTLNNMKPFTNYQCGGQFEYDSTDFYDINPPINFTTLQGNY